MLVNGVSISRPATQETHETTIKVYQLMRTNAWTHSVTAIEAISVRDALNKRRTLNQFHRVLVLKIRKT